MNSIIDKLDFSTREHSWFDLWHMHVDWDGEGNKDWETRKKYLDNLVASFKKLRQQLKDYPHQYQTWILINELESKEDAIYIHSPNPNANNFPMSIERNAFPTFSNKKLEQYLLNLPLEIITTTASNNGQRFFLVDKNSGLSIIE